MDSCFFQMSVCAPAVPKRAKRSEDNTFKATKERFLKHFRPSRGSATQIPSRCPKTSPKSCPGGRLGPPPKSENRSWSRPRPPRELSRSRPRAPRERLQRPPGAQEGAESLPEPPAGRPRGHFGTFSAPFRPVLEPFGSFFGSFLALVLRLFSDASSGLLFSSVVSSSASCAALAVLRVSAKNDDPLMEFWLFPMSVCAPVVPKRAKRSDDNTFKK